MATRSDPLSLWERVGVRASKAMFWSIYPLSLSLSLNERGPLCQIFKNRGPRAAHAVNYREARLDPLSLWERVGVRA